jgi:hypothetical protein
METSSGAIRSVGIAASCARDAEQNTNSYKANHSYAYPLDGNVSQMRPESEASNQDDEPNHVHSERHMHLRGLRIGPLPGGKQLERHTPIWI